MTAAEIVRNKKFKEVSRIKLDQKKRATLTRSGVVGKTYTVYENADGQIILDPMAIISEAELWLLKNPKALAAVHQGLKQSAEGKVKKRGSMAKYADDEIE